MAYQPVVWAERGERFGYEALLRTDAGQVGSACAFLNIAERLGNTVYLGRSIRQRVAKNIDGFAGAVLVNLHALERPTSNSNHGRIRCFPTPDVWW